MKEYNGKNTASFFNNKQDYYDKYRPGYDNSIIKILEEKYNFNKECVIAEYGAGTGNFSFMISNFCKKVYSVEPNADMLGKAKNGINNINIVYLQEKAENTSIEDNSIDFAFAVHSFHYFEIKKFKKELLRVLKNNGYFVIVWYDYFDKNNPFSLEWVNFVDKNKKMADNHNYIKNRELIFKNGLWQEEEIIIKVSYDKFSLLGLALSISTIPLKNMLGYSEMEEELFKLFEKYQVNNKVNFDLHLRIQIGKIK